MPAKRNVVFIDTNIYLKFYSFSTSDLKTLETLSTYLDKKHLEIVITQQLKDEFYRNRESTIQKSIDDFMKINFNQKIPTLFLNEISAYKELLKAKKEYENKYNNLLRNIKDSAINESLKADEIISNIFESSHFIKNTNKIYGAALARMRAKNPPGKPNELGDAIHWESFLADLKKGNDLIIISDDGDFRDELDKLRAKPFLIKEWKSKKNSNLIYFQDLNIFFKKYLPHFELQDQIKEKIRELLDCLNNSESFRQTHIIIDELSQYIDDIDENDIKSIIECCFNNNQVLWIIDDPDIRDFILKLQQNTNLDEVTHERISRLISDDNEY
ncbi:PIN domain-containing protein [Legionella sp. 16cNR16C]|uniref:PIN domain-containing protein n=1 Tax=Legionella sp. 16cNR16C TaxID=2905656 RepID=UPI001E3A2A02|nr:PIN domain-containing protein [Legionella sp. 16cNR16C]MCE3044168.1 PIN domain-containing protein [Legionella sp. 16cNR16C]